MHSKWMNRVYLRTEPPICDEDLVFSGRYNVAHGRHEGATVHEPVRGLQGSNKINFLKTLNIKKLIDYYWKFLI